MNALNPRFLESSSSDLLFGIHFKLQFASNCVLTVGCEVNICLFILFPAVSLPPLFFHRFKSSKNQARKRSIQVLEAPPLPPQLTPLKMTLKLLIRLDFFKIKRHIGKGLYTLRQYKMYLNVYPINLLKEMFKKLLFGLPEAFLVY